MFAIFHVRLFFQSSKNVLGAPPGYINFLIVLVRAQIVASVADFIVKSGLLRYMVHAAQCVLFLVNPTLYLDTAIFPLSHKAEFQSGPP